MKTIRLNLDEQADADIILELEKRANGGALSRALYRVICEWFARALPEGANRGLIGPSSGLDVAESGPDELATALAEIDDSWN